MKLACHIIMPDFANDTGVCLTFDDNYILEWFSALKSFKKYKAKATFFVSHFDKLSGSELDMLKEIESHGHEIGYHTISHFKPTDFLAKYSIEEYVKHEIFPGLELMSSAGFEPRSFAFPYNDSTCELQTKLLELFDILRLRADVLFEALYKKNVNNKILRAQNIDLHTNSSSPEIKFRILDDIVEEFRIASKRDKIIATYAHGISNRVVHHPHISLWGLEYLLHCAHEIGLSFYKASELTI